MRTIKNAKEGEIVEVYKFYCVFWQKYFWIYVFSTKKRRKNERKQNKTKNKTKINKNK